MVRPSYVLAVSHEIVHEKVNKNFVKEAFKAAEKIQS